VNENMMNKPGNWRHKTQQKNIWL